MPRPRFARLPATRRAHLLEVAAREFATRGYEDTSINRVLEQAGISKGAAYYYFDDKEDLFVTVVDYYAERLGLAAIRRLGLARLTRETFWPTLSELYRDPLVRSRDDPWAFGVVRAAHELWRKQSETGPLAAYVQQMLDFLAAFLHAGQRLGLVRTDLPDDLLMGWVMALDDANDRWVLEHWHELDRDGLVGAAERFVEALRGLISPRPVGGNGVERSTAPDELPI